jgi:hypothetical protein
VPGVLDTKLIDEIIQVGFGDPLRVHS